MLTNSRSRPAWTAKRPMPRFSSVCQTSGLYERVNRITNEIGSLRPRTEARRRMISNGSAIFPFSTSSSSAGSLRSMARPTSLTVMPAASRIPRRTAPVFSSAARCSGLTSIALAAPIENSAAAPPTPSTESVQARTCFATPASGSGPSAGSAFLAGARRGTPLRETGLRTAAMFASVPRLDQRSPILPRVWRRMLQRYAGLSSEDRIATRFAAPSVVTCIFFAHASHLWTAPSAQGFHPRGDALRDRRRLVLRHARVLVYVAGAVALSCHGAAWRSSVPVRAAVRGNPDPGTGRGARRAAFPATGFARPRVLPSRQCGQRRNVDDRSRLLPARRLRPFHARLSRVRKKHREHAQRSGAPCRRARGVGCDRASLSGKADCRVWAITWERARRISRARCASGAARPGFAVYEHRRSGKAFLPARTRVVAQVSATHRGDHRRGVEPGR